MLLFTLLIALAQASSNPREHFVITWAADPEDFVQSEAAEFSDFFSYTRGDLRASEAQNIVLGSNDNLGMAKSAVKRALETLKGAKKPQITFVLVSHGSDKTFQAGGSHIYRSEFISEIYGELRKAGKPLTFNLIDSTCSSGCSIKPVQNQLIRQSGRNIRTNVLTSSRPSEISFSGTLLDTIEGLNGRIEHAKEKRPRLLQQICKNCTTMERMAMLMKKFNPTFESPISYQGGVGYDVPTGWSSNSRVVPKKWNLGQLTAGMELLGPMIHPEVANETLEETAQRGLHKKAVAKAYMRQLKAYTRPLTKSVDASQPAGLTDRRLAAAVRSVVRKNAKEIAQAAIASNDKETLGLLAQKIPSSRAALLKHIPSNQGAFRNAVKYQIPDPNPLAPRKKPRSAPPSKSCDKLLQQIMGS